MEHADGAARRKQTDKDEDNSEMSAFYAHVVCENAFTSVHSGVILGTPREKKKRQEA